MGESYGGISGLRHQIVIMRYAILADIHSNWEALETAVHYLAKKKINEVWVLGDTVGYGANPNECFDWVIQHARVALMGNHEKAVIEPSLREEFNPEAKIAVAWTAEVLKPEHQKKIRGLPYLHIRSSSTAAHGSPDEPETFRYLFSFADARPSFAVFKTPICFVGHTHYPALFTESKGTTDYLAAGKYALKKEERYIINPGSVGQPRDWNPRLGFGIFDDEEWTFEQVRLEYDYRKAAEKIRQAGLPASLADRLS